MSLFKLHSLFKPQKTPKPLSLSLPFLLTKTLTSTPQTPKKTPLDILFKEAVGLSEIPETNESITETEKTDFKNNLLGLEREIRRLKEESKHKVNVKLDEKKLFNEKKPKKAESLYAMFVKKNENEEKVGNGEGGEEENRVFKELSPEMEEFVRHLYREGYFNKANFLPRGKLDFGCFENGYGRDFIKFAAEKFGKDHQEIAK